MYKNSVINYDTYVEIQRRIIKAEFSNFEPFLMIIPKTEKIISKLEIVKPENKASFVSDEYIIKNLNSAEFQTISLKE